MRLTLWTLFGLVAWVFCGAAAPVLSPRFSSPHLADYDSELRGPDQRVDTDALVQRLKDLGVTAYYWLVWHNPHDWDDLLLFLPKAAEAHIQVWVYLVPPTEGPPSGYPASEPFKLDYPRWGEEIARLSLVHTNLTGWVIDDFYANHTLFTPEYVSQMQARAKAVNPHLVFLPLMYFPEITPQFVEAYHAVIDGVVVAYPADLDEIKQARATLNGDRSATPCTLSYPPSSASRPGDFCSVMTGARRLPGQPARLRFEEMDDFTGPTAGYHFKQMLVNGHVVWESDVAGGRRDWHLVEVDASSAAGTSSNLTLSFRLVDKRGVSNFGVKWRVRNLQVQGLQLKAGLDQPEQWRVTCQGPFEAGFGAGLRKPSVSVHVPFIVMTAGSAAEFKLRHGEPASPKRMAEWLQMCLEARRAGLVDGVVTYCLDKSSGSRVFPLAAKLFHQAAM